MTLCHTIIVPNMRKTWNSHIFFYNDRYTSSPTSYESIKLEELEGHMLLIKDGKCKSNPFY